MGLNIRFNGIPTDMARALQRGGPDAYGKTPERAVSDGDGNPCRHCLEMIAKDEPMLVFALRPFSGEQPYAETGPAFLHASECRAHEGTDDLPPVLHDSPAYIVRGYGSDERIAYGTGGVVDQRDISKRAAELLGDENISFVDVRSASNNCWQARVTRDS